MDISFKNYALAILICVAIPAFAPSIPGFFFALRDIWEMIVATLLVFLGYEDQEPAENPTSAEPEYDPNDTHWAEKELHQV